MAGFCILSLGLCGSDLVLLGSDSIFTGLIIGLISVRCAWSFHVSFYMCMCTLTLCFTAVLLRLVKELRSYTNFLQL
jgi:hypothetical protein